MKRSVESPALQQTSLTLVSNALIDLISWNSSRKSTFLLLSKTPFGLPCMQTSRISTWFITNYAKFAHSTRLPKCSDQQTKFQIQFSSGSYFPKHTKFHRYKWTPVKVTSTRYEAVSYTHLRAPRDATLSRMPSSA